MAFVKFCDELRCYIPPPGTAEPPGDATSYTPVRLGANTFRLALLFPGARDDPLRCSFFSLPLAAAPHYTALSYTWGNPTITSRLWVSRETIGITATLALALRRLRDVRLFRPVWIDAVCINQKDNEEKSTQIQLMRDIYSRARHVTIYLGEAKDGSEMLPLLFHQIFFAGANFGSRGPGVTLPLHKTLPYSKYEAIGLPNYDSPVWDNFRAFLRRSWFRRIWIIQEAIVSNMATFICGEWSLPWELFAQMYQVAMTNEMALLDRMEQDDERAAASRMLVFMIVFRPRDSLFTPQWKLIQLLHRCSISSATDARDYVFGILGLSLEADEYDLRPNYQQTFEQVYLRVAKYFVRHGDGMGVLYNAGRTTNKSLPSWVPNWACKDVAYPRLCPEPRLDPRNITCKYFAGSKSMPSIRLHPSLPDVLVVKGVRFDTVKLLGSIRYSNPPDDLTLGALHDFHLIGGCIQELHQMLRQETSYPTNEELSAAIWQTFVCNGWADLGLPIDATCYQAFNMDMQRIDKSWPMPPMRSMAEMQSEEKPFHQSGRFIKGAREFCFTRRRVVTWGGCAAQVPLNTQVGDSIFVPVGSAVPFIIRPKIGGREGFELIGECYVYGIMNGEVFGEGCNIVDTHLV